MAVYNPEIFKSIKDDIERDFEANPIKINIDNSILKDVKDLIDSLDNLNIKVDKSLSENINKIIGALSSTDLDQTLKSIESLNNILESLYNATKYDQKDIEHINENIEGISKLFDDSNIKVNFRELFRSISEIVGDDKIKEINKDLSGINSTLQTIITIISIDPNTINLKGLNILLNISDPKNGKIKQLIKNLHNLTTTEGANINSKPIIAIGDFFEALSSIGEIGLLKRRRIKSNIKYFSKFIGSEIPKLINEINKSADRTIDSDTVKSIAALSNIFESIVKIGEIDFKHKIRMKLNLMYIRYFIMHDITKILSELVESINKLSPEVFKSLEQLNALFDKIFEIGEKSLFKFIKLGINLSILEAIIKDQLIGDIKEKNGILIAIANINGQIINNALNKIDKLNEIFDSLGNIIDNDSISLVNVMLFILKLSIISKYEKSIEDIISFIGGFDGRTLNSIINKTEKLQKIFNEYASIIERIGNLDISIKKSLSIYGALIINKGIVKNISSIIEELNNVNPSDNIEKTLNLIKILLSLKGSILKAKILNKSLSVIQNSINKIKEICDNINDDIKDDDLKRAQEVLGTFNNILLKAAAVLLLGGLVMKWINPVKLLMFGVTLAGFMWGITNVFSLMSKSIEDNIKVSHEAIELIAISGLILIIGSLAMNLIKPGNLILFAVTLGVFMLMISTAYLIFSKSSNTVFGAAKDFALLIAVSAGVLIFGALFMKTGLWLEAIGFGLMLAVFIGGIVFIYKWASKGITSALGIASELAILIAVSAMTLMIGALFMSKPKRIIGALLFGVILGLFIGGILGLMKWASKHIKSSISTMVAISVLITIAAATLLIGGTLFTLFPSLPGNVILFGIVLLGFVTLIGLICIGLNALKKYIQPGLIILGGIIILVGMAAIAIGLIAIVTWMIESIAGGHIEILQTLGVMAAVFGGLALLCGIIGFPEIAAYVGLGIIVVGAMTILLYLMIGAMAALVAVTKYASTLKEEDVTKLFGKGLIGTGLFAQMIWGLAKLGPAFIALSAEIAFMMPGIAGTIMLSTALSIVAKTLQMWADLKIPEYDNNGKIIGYKTIDGSAFTTAASNIKIVLKTLFSAVKEVYDEDTSGMFNVDWSTVLTGQTPFARVISSSLKMGNMLTSIASGIKAWAKLRIPEYGKDGKIVGYKTIDNTAFVTAAENIKTVITCLGQAIIDTYEAAPEGMFTSNEWLGFGNTPFAKVTKALKTMGPMLSSIAHGIKDWSDLKIPIYGKGKKATTVVGYKQLTNGDFTKAAGHIIDVVKTLATAVLDVYNNAPDGMFDDDSWLGLNHTPFAIVCRSLKTMGSALGNIAEAVQYWADLKIPIYGDAKDATKIIGYKTIDDGVFKQVATNISIVVQCLASGIASLATGENKDLFTDDDFWSGDTPVHKVLKSIKPMGSALKDIADAIVAWSSMQVPVYGEGDNSTKIIRYDKITPTDINNAKDKMGQVIKTLIEGISNVYYGTDESGNFELKKLFDKEHTILGISFGDTPVEKVLAAIVPIGKSLKNIADAIKAWVELKIPIYDKNGGLEPTGYLSIGGEEGINAAINNIQKVLKAMIIAVASVYYGKIVIGKGEPLEYQKLFENGDKSIINIMTEQMSKVAGLISKAAKGVQDIANLKIPVYNKKGKVIAYHNIENGTFDKVGSVISMVLTAIGNAIINVANNPLLDVENNPNFKAAVEAIKYSTDILSSLAGVVANYATGKFVVYEVQKGKLVPTKTIDITKQDVISNFKTNIETVLLAIGDSLKTLLGQGKSDNGLKYATEKNKQQIERTKTVINTLITNISEIFKALGDLNKVYTENKKDIDLIIKPASDEEKFDIIIGNVISKTNEIFQKLTNNTEEIFLEDSLSKLSNKKEKLLKDINNAFTILNTLLIKASKLANDNYKLRNANFNNISSTIEKFANALDDINKKVNESKRLTSTTNYNIKNLIAESQELVTLLGNFVDIINRSSSINNETYEGLSKCISGLYLTIMQIGTENNLNFISYTNLLDEYIKVINKAGYTSIFNENVNSLKDGILNIFSIIKQVDQLGNFKNHIKDLENYIEAINNIDLSRINSLRTLVDSLNQLSQRLGNLDNLTDALSNKLSAVLLELVNQLKKAEATISNAHELQERRKKLIEESVETVKSLMANPMIVEISQKTDEDEDTQPKGYSDGNSLDLSKPTGTDTESTNNKTFPELESPENNIVDNKSNKGQYQNNLLSSDALTMTEFMRLMQLNMKGWGDK